MNLSTMAPLLLPQALSTVVDNDVSKSSMINALGEGGLLPKSSLLLPGKTYFGAGFTPGPATIVLYWDFLSYCGLGGS